MSERERAELIERLFNIGCQLSAEGREQDGWDIRTAAQALRSPDTSPPSHTVTVSNAGARHDVTPTEAEFSLEKYGA